MSLEEKVFDEMDLLQAIYDQLDSDEDDFSSRKLRLYGEIKEYDSEDGILSSGPRIEALCEKIMRYNFEDEKKNIAPKDRKPIKLFINSPGGTIHEGCYLIDIIEMSDTPVFTINVGKCFSMAFLIFIAGHKRYSLKSATFLLHDGTSGVYGSTNKVQDLVEFYKHFEEKKMKPLIARHTNISEEEYEARKREERYFLAEEAEELGCIDVMVEKISEIL